MTNIANFGIEIAIKNNGIETAKSTTSGTSTDMSNSAKSGIKTVMANNANVGMVTAITNSATSGIKRLWQTLAMLAW